MPQTTTIKRGQSNLTKGRIAVRASGVNMHGEHAPLLD